MYYYNGDTMNIEELKRLGNMELYKYLIKNEELLKETEIRDLLLENERYYALVWIVQNIKNSNNLLDEDMVNRVLKNNKNVELIELILVNCIDNANFIKNEKVLNIIFSTDIINNINYLNIVTARYVMEYMVKNNEEKYFPAFTETVKIELLQEPKYLNHILNSPFLKNILQSSQPKVFNELIKYEKSKNIIFSSDPKYITNIILNNVTLPDSVALDKKFQNMILNIDSIISYRYFMDNFVKNNTVSAYEIDEKRNRMYDKMIEEYDGLFPQIKRIIESIENNLKYDNLFNNDIVNFMILEGININNLKSRIGLFYKYDIILMKNILIDRFFKDNPTNFCKNLNVMISYNESLNDKVIDEKRFKLYKEIQNFENLSFEDRKRIYNECLKYNNLVEIFYDDYKNSQNKSYKDLISAAINPRNMSKQLSLQKSELYGVPVYELKGEEFFAFIHVSGQSKYDPNLKLNVWKEKLHDGLSLSYIGSKNIRTYNNPKDLIAFGFSNLDYTRFVHLRNSDSFSNYDSLSGIHSDYVQKMYTPENLVKETIGYNEIVYQEKSKKIELSKLMPDYVICYNDISIADKEVAKYYNIPIVVIDTNAYNYNNQYVDDSPKEKYDQNRKL